MWQAAARRVVLRTYFCISTKIVDDQNDEKEEEEDELEKTRAVKYRRVQGCRFQNNLRQTFERVYSYFERAINFEIVCTPHSNVVIYLGPGDVCHLMPNLNIKALNV